MKTTKAIKLLLSLAVVSSSFAGALANDAVLNSDPIDINGYVQEVPPTDQELEQVKNDVRYVKQQTKINKEKTKNYKKLAKETEKLADTSEEMIEERAEAQAIASSYKAKIDCLMGRESGEECNQYVKTKKDTVSTGMAAPAPAKVEAKVDATPQLGDVIKVLPYAGITSFQSENEDLEAEMSAGIRVESDITARFSIGLGFNYTTLKTTDFKNGYAGYMPGTFYDRYSQMYGAGREIEYKNMNFDIYSKYFITKTSRFRPYVGLGAAYNRTTSKYTDNRNTTIPYGTASANYQYQFGDEEITSNLMSARILAGSEILFSDSIGANLELQYSKALGSSFGDQESRVEGPDQKRLRELSAEINDAHTFSVSAGILVLF